MKKIHYSAPGKVILSGEHSVVYGKPALVSAIKCRLHFKIWEDNLSTDPTIKYISQIVRTYLKENNIIYSERPFQYIINSNIPIKKGLGSSAALSVSATAAFWHFYTGNQPTKNIVNSLAYLIEKRFHTNPSGADTSTSCFGGFIYYRKEFDFLKSITQLDFPIPKTIDKMILLIDSGSPKESTAQMVEKVKFLFRSQRIPKQILDEMEQVTKDFTLALKLGNLTAIKKSVLANEILLEKIKVVSNKTKQLLNNLTSCGFGKITGAGGKQDGSGYILFFAEKKDKIESYLKHNRISFIKFQQDSEGLQYEN